MAFNLLLAVLLYYVLLPADLVSLYKLLAGSIIYLAVFILMMRTKEFGIYETNKEDEKA